MCIRDSHLREHSGSRVKSVSTSGDLKRAVICLFDSTVSVWDIEKHEIISCIQKWGQRDASIGHTSGTIIYLIDCGNHVLAAVKLF